MNIPLNIDWQQIVLHLFNFAVLTAGLYVLLYKPVKDFMEKRELYYRTMDENAHIKLEEAETKYRETEQKWQSVEEEIREKRELETKRMQQETLLQTEEARKQCEAILCQAKENANQEREKILDEARQQVAELAVAAIEKLASSTNSGSLDQFIDENCKEGTYD